MSLIEGLGDEVTVVLGVVLVFAVLSLAWLSTHTSDLPSLGIMVVEYNRRRRSVHDQTAASDPPQPSATVDESSSTGSGQQNQTGSDGLETGLQIPTSSLNAQAGNVNPPQIIPPQSSENASRLAGASHGGDTRTEKSTPDQATGSRDASHLEGPPTQFVADRVGGDGQGNLRGEESAELSDPVRSEVRETGDGEEGTSLSQGSPAVGGENISSEAMMRQRRLEYFQSCQKGGGSGADDDKSKNLEGSSPAVAEGTSGIDGGSVAHSETLPMKDSRNLQTNLKQSESSHSRVHSSQTNQNQTNCEGQNVDTVLASSSMGSAEPNNDNSSNGSRGLNDMPTSGDNLSTGALNIDSSDSQTQCRLRQTQHTTPSVTTATADTSTTTASSREPPVQGSTPGSQIRVKLKYMNETQRLVYANPLDTIGHFRRTHFQEELEANKWVRFIYNGQDLRDDARTLQACNVGDNCTMHCLITTHTAPAASRDTALDEEEESVMGAMMYPLFCLVLAVVWYFRFTYRQYFSAMSTVCLIGISFLLVLSYFSSMRTASAAPEQAPRTGNGRERQPRHLHLD